MRYMLFILGNICDNKTCPVLVLSFLFFLCSCNHKTNLDNFASIEVKIFEEEIICLSANNPEDINLINLMEFTRKEQINKTDENYFESIINIYKSEFEANFSLIDLFFCKEEQKANSFNSEESLLKLFEDEYAEQTNRTIEILNKRIQSLGVESVEIHKSDDQTGLLLLEVKGFKCIDAIKRMITTPGRIEFWETYNIEEIFPALDKTNELFIALEPKEHELELKHISEITETETNYDVLYLDGDEIIYSSNQELETINNHGLFERLLLQTPFGSLAHSCVVGFVLIDDVHSLMHDLKRCEIRELLPMDLQFATSIRPLANEPNYFQVISLKRGKTGGAALDGSSIIDAEAFYGNNNEGVIVLEMNESGSNIWEKLTKRNIDRNLAIVFDNHVLSWPIVKSSISGGKTQITGEWTFDESKEIAIIINYGSILSNNILSIDITK